jgi:hypothetical protein
MKLFLEQIFFGCRDVQNHGAKGRVHVASHVASQQEAKPPMIVTRPEGPRACRFATGGGRRLAPPVANHVAKQRGSQQASRRHITARSADDC